MLPCEHYLEDIHLHSYQGSSYNPLFKDCALHQSVLMAGCVLHFLHSGSIPVKTWTQPLHHHQTGTTGLKNYNAGMGWMQERQDSSQRSFKREHNVHKPGPLWLPVVWAGLIAHVIWPRHFTGKVCQSSKLQLSLLCEDVDAFKPCALQVSPLCITLLVVYGRTGFICEPSLIADGSTVTGVVYFGFWGEALPCFHLHTTSIYPNVLLIPAPPHPTALKLLHNNCKFYSAQIRLFPLTQKQTDC